MKEARLQVFRSAVDGLIESLDAVVRISRWNDKEAKPEPLVAAEAKLLDRLGTASRLSTTRFQGTGAEVGKVEACCVILRQLDAAYLAYRRHLDSPAMTPATRVDAAATLEAELATASSGVATWR